MPTLGSDLSGQLAEMLMADGRMHVQELLSSPRNYITLRVGSEATLDSCPIQRRKYP